MEDDDEAQRLEELRRIKRTTLHELDKQAAQYSSVNIPPHIQTERQRLRRELGLVESVIASPLGAQIGNELEEGGRFVAYLELMRAGDKATLEAVARVEERLAGLHAEYRDGRMRRDVFLIIIMVVVVILAMVLIFWIGRVSDGRGLVSDLFALLGK